MSKKEKIIKSKNLIKESWQVYSKNLLKFIEVFVYGLIGMLPFFGVLILSLVYAGFLGNKMPFLVNAIVLVIAIVAFVATLYMAIVYSVRAKVASILLLKNNFTSAKENFNEAKPYFVKFLGVSLLMTVLVIAWGFVLIVPALIFAIYYGFAQYVLVVEGKRPFSAIERSYDLVRGYFWPVFGRMALIGLIGLIIYWIISLPLNGMIEGEPAYMGYNFLVNVIWAIISPYFLVYVYKVYQSLKETNK